jgi:Yip1 domain.
MEETKMSMIQRFVKVLTSPRKAFASIADDPRILWAGLIIIIINMILTILIWPETKLFTEQSLTASGQSPDQIARAMKFVQSGALIRAIISMPFMWLLQAAILTTYNQFSMGEARFKQLFAVAIFSSIPLTIKGVITTGLTKAMGFKASLQVSTSLALFWGNADSSSLIYHLMGKLELFSIWGLILLILGGAAAMKKSATGLAVFMGAIWIIYVVVVALLVKTPAV